MSGSTNFGKVCVFDAYGTLFDVAAAARACAAEPGREAFAEKWVEVAETWRLKQLQYTWLRALTGDHTDFWSVTGESLDFALEATQLAEPTLRERLLQLYFELEAFAEVPAMLRALKDSGSKLAILSNGEPKMLDAAAQSAGIDSLLDDILSVESVGVFKPHPSVYDLVGQRFDCERAEVVFVSSNGWDACSAAAYGFFTVWVNRRNEPVDRLAARPNEILSDLSALPGLVASRKGQN
ncbi:MAG: haloacid dehalogenase type II [Pseudomonadota bacterium]